MADEPLMRLRERVAAARGIVYGPAATSNPSGFIDDLQQLMIEARARPDAQPELRQVLILGGVVECQRGEPAKARALLREGVAIEAPRPVDLDQLTKDHYLLASVSSDLKDFAFAAEHYGRAATLADAAPGFDISRRLGIRERHAFALHEAKRFLEAYEVNVALLDDGERHFGTDDPCLSTVLINTAQNLYALGRLAEAEGYLLRGLKVARTRNDMECEQDLLYQLAVLASEQGRPAQARDHLTARIERLARMGESQRLETARRGLEQFDRRRAKAF